MGEILRVEGLRAMADQPEPGWSFRVGEGFNLLRNRRENESTALALAIAGRKRAAAGSILLEGRELSTRARFRRVALAGATEIDRLERLVPVRAVIREQVAWAQPAWRRTPRDILSHPLVGPWLEPLALNPDPELPVGELDPLDRYALRVLLGLVARPRAALLVADDVDQLRDMRLRAEMLRRFDAVSRRLPVLVLTVNLADDDPVDAVIDLAATEE